MAGSASNWFKPTSGPMKGQAVYLAQANQKILLAGAKRGESVLGRLERGDALAITLARGGQKPAGIAGAAPRPSPAPAASTDDDDLFGPVATPAAGGSVPGLGSAPAQTQTPSAAEADDAASFFERLGGIDPGGSLLDTPLPIVRQSGKPPADMADLFPEDALPDVAEKLGGNYTPLVPERQRRSHERQQQRQQERPTDRPSRPDAPFRNAQAGFVRALRGVGALARLAALPVTTSLAVVRATLQQLRPDTRRSVLLSAGAVVLGAATAGIAPPALAVALLAAEALAVRREIG